MNNSFTKFIKRLSKQALSRILLSGMLLTGLSLSVSAQYCIPVYVNGCTFQEDLNGFTLTGQGASNINDLLTGCGPNNGYEDRTTVVAAVDLMQGATYSGTVTTNFFSNQFYRIWIDFDNNNTFDPAEDLTGNIGPFGSINPSNFNITIPLTAPLGQHRMRVRLVSNVAAAIDPCANYQAGETHDYLVNILAAPPCGGQPAFTGISPAGPINSCSGVPQTITATIMIAAGNTFQWQTSTDGGLTWTNVGTNSLTYNFTISGSAWYRVYVICTNTNLSDTSPVVVINTNPPVYASIPYFQDFENWVNYCNTLDIPDGSAINWTNSPSTGDNSWRRDDQGNSANWSAPWGAYFPAFLSGQHSARFASAAIQFGSPATSGNLDLYLDCSQQTADKQLYFYFINDGSFSSGDSLAVFLSTDAGTTFNQIGSFDTAVLWKKRTLPIASSSAQTILRFQGKNPNFDFTDIGLDSVYIAPPCSGAVIAGTITPGGVLSDCPGNNFTFSVTGATMGGNITYQWQSSTDGVNWTNIAGANTIFYTTPALYDTVYYRMYMVCNGSGLSDTTAVVTLNIASPVYATLPYSQGFEGWMSFCDNFDVPSNNWINKPATGDLSWRRDDEGFTANWWNPAGGAYSPVSYQGSHSARFHTWNANWQSTGDLDLFVDCSALGNKELQFQHINPSGSDELQIWMSTDGGVTFNQLQFFNNAVNWTLRSVPVNSTSAQTVIRFRAISDFSDDIGIDEAMVLLPCAGTPVAGVVDSLLPCSGQNFTIGATGTTLAAGLAYQWQTSPDGINWTNAVGGNSYVLTTSITAPTYFRLIVTCTNSNISDTTASKLLDIASFYYCYCNSAAVFNSDDDIGNFAIRKYPGNSVVLSNGSASPLTNNSNATKVYTDYTNLAPVPLYKDSVYKFTITQINQQAFNQSNVAIFLDMNRDGTFDPATEKVFLQPTTAPSQQATDTFRIPSTAQVGITGLRVVLVQGAFSFPLPCSPYTFGETEDYLVFIDYPPCNGPTNEGIAYISDTLLCPGFPITLTDTSHEKFRTGITWVWQSSTDNLNWTDIAGSTDVDILPQITGTNTTYYRLQMTCTVTNSITYSNTVHVTIKPPHLCYCQSFANGGNANDVSDAGAFTMGNYIINTGGSHLNNGSAVKSYTSYDGPANVLTLYQDSTYNVSVYHVMKSATHQDAKITLFIDYNNNFVYDIPDERVYTGFTTSTNVYLNTTVNIPNTSVTEVLTGMRLIVNNDVNPNVPSDEACGTYTSGETEDFTVKIRDKSKLGIGHLNGRLGDFTIFPNPTNGKFVVKLISSNQNEGLQLRVTTVTGQQVYYRAYNSPGKVFTTEIDLEGRAAGIYFVELSDGAHKAVKKLMLK